MPVCANISSHKKDTMNLYNISTIRLEKALTELNEILDRDFHSHAYNKPEIEIEGERMRLMTAEIEIELLRRSLPYDFIERVRGGNISTNPSVQ